MKLKNYLMDYRHMLVPLLLTVLLSSSVFYVYGVRFFSVYTLLSTLIAIGMFVFCTFIKKHNVIGGILYTILLFFCLRMYFYYAFGTGYALQYMEWFLTGASETQTQDVFLISLLVSFPFFFSTVIFYFTDILYRPAFLMLISIIPCCLYVKVLSEMNNVYIALIAISNLGIMVTMKKKDASAGCRKSGSTASVLSSAAFVFIVLIISAAIPKSTDTKYYEKFERVFMNADARVRFSENFSAFSEFSGNADRYSNFRNSLMYTLYAEEIIYLRRQTFDLYDNSEHRWRPVEQYSRNNSLSAREYTEHIKALNLADMQAAIKKAAEYDSGFAEKYGLEKLCDFRQIEETIRTVQVTSENFPAVFYISPVRPVSISMISKYSPEISVTANGVMRNTRDDEMHPADVTYQLEYYDEMTSRFYWFELGGADFTDDEYEAFLSEIYTILSSNGEDDAANTVNEYMLDYSQAADYKDYITEYSAHISDEIAELARTVTAGCTYDWEKATALQQYLAFGDYIYNLEYIPPEGFDTPEYFLFESKKGTCSDFATAFTLMARSLGLNVRYTEGFSPDITSSPNRYIIRDSCSHAYPEVFIQNMGWIVFEPTTASPYSNAYVGGTDDTGTVIDYSLIAAVCGAAVIIMSLMLLSIIALPGIREQIFISKLRNAQPDDAVRMTYAGIVRYYSEMTRRNGSKRTPRELMTDIAEFTGSDEASDFSRIIEKVCYAEESASDSDKAHIMEEYEVLKKQLKASAREAKKTRLKKGRGHNAKS
ncbi:MAG: transglutaminase family protein [Huintestinicola sp.]